MRTTISEPLPLCKYPVSTSDVLDYVILEIGRQVHSVVIKRSFANNLFVNNAFVDMYAKAGALKEARK
ncbi:hypothetical protein HN51_027916 [Arachis hypogaea]